MFFVLSKTLGVALLPTNFLIGLGVVGAFLLPTRISSAGRKLLVIAAIGLAICGFSPLGNWLLYPLESRFPPWDASEGAPDGIIVLGGPIDPDISAARKVPVIRNAPDRIVTAAILARKYPNARIIFTGGNADLASNDAREADYAGDIFEGLGISKARLIMERRSRNTFENAEFSKQLAAPKAGEHWLLITSAYHMPRAVGLFRKVGFVVEPYPVDWRLRGRADMLSFSDLAIAGLEQTDIAVHEWIGLLAYRLTGKIDDLLPGPSRG